LEPFTDGEVPYAVTEIAKHFRPIATTVLLIINKGVCDSGNKVIENGDADMVAFGPPFSNESRFINWYVLRRDLAKPLTKITFYTFTARRYNDYPKMESIYRKKKLICC
jgi:N-ethylmaleimide reductase